MDIAGFKRLAGPAIFGATFVKKDGTTRTGTFRFGVSKGVKGVGLGYDAEARGNMIVYDMKKRGFRTIAVDRLVSVRLGGQEFQIQDES